MICIDGVNSMTGNAPDLAAFAALAREHDVILYVDDAHGFGVVGERSPDEPCDYGVRGNSIVRHAGGELRERRPGRRLLQGLLVAAGIHRLPDRAQAGAEDRGAAVPVLGPLAGRLARHRPRGTARQRGARRSAARANLHRLTGRVLDRVRELGIYTPNQSGFPIIEIPLADADSVDEVGNLLFDRGIYVTMAVYPLVPRDEVGFRLQVTAANTDEQVDHLCVVLGEVAERFKLRRAAAE